MKDRLGGRQPIGQHERVDERFEQVNERIFATQWIMIAVGGGMIATLAAALVTVLGSHV